MPSKLYRDEAIVLRTYKLGEADRIIVMLSRHHGQIRGVAKGVRRTTSRFGARLESFSMVDVQLHAGRSLDVITQVDTIRALAGEICTDYTMFTCASTMVETAERLTDSTHVPGMEGPAGLEGPAGTRDPRGAGEFAMGSPQQYLMLYGALSALASRSHAPGLILDSYLLRALALAGWAPSCFDCAICGRPGPHTAFHVQAGGAVCESCRPAGSVEVSPATMRLLGALLSGEWAAADASQPQDRAAASGLVSAYLTWHLERRLRSLALVERE